MANKITKEQIYEMNVLYLKYHTYAAVAREIGCSAGTVKKYIVPNFQIVDESTIVRFTKEMIPEYSGTAFRGIDNYGDLTVLSEEEIDEIHALQKEIEI